MKDIHLLTERIAKSSVYWKPDIALKATFNYMGSRFPFIETDWYRQNDYGFNLSLGLKTTLWDGGKKLNEIKKASLNVTSANTEVEKVKETIKKTLHENINAYEISQIRIEYLELKIETLESKVKQQELLKKTGYGSDRTLIQAEIEKGTAEIEQLQHKISRIQAYNIIHFLTE
jgi:outer membrane protein TolC